MSLPIHSHARTPLGLLAVILLGGALLLAGCANDLVRASGTVVDRDVSVGGFRSIEASHTFHVRYTPGGDAGVTLHVDQNVIDDVVAEIRGDALVLSVDGVSTLGSMTIEADVTGPAVERLEASGAARIEVTGPLASKQVQLVVEGASRLDGPVAVKDLALDVSGASRVTLSGTADQLHGTVSGASRLSGEELTATDADLDVSGASRADVTVTGDLTYDVSGASRLTYAGGATSGHGETSGGSSATER